MRCAGSVEFRRTRSIRSRGKKSSVSQGPTSGTLARRQPDQDLAEQAAQCRIRGTAADRDEVIVEGEKEPFRVTARRVV